MSRAEPAVLPGVWVAWAPLSGSPDPCRLTGDELSIFEALPGGDRRRLEWWAGRMAGRAALDAAGSPGLSILRADSGAPRLQGDGADSVHLAITHGRAWAAAAATRADGPWPNVGIDLVDASDVKRIQSIAKRVFKPWEQAEAAADPKRGLLFWAAREAVAKATRTGMFLFALSRCWVTAVDDAAGRAEVNVPGTALAFTWQPDGSLLVIAGASPEALTFAARPPNRP